MSRAYIGIGSNEGDRLERISQAVRRLGAISGVTVEQMATVFDTEPVGGPPQPNYLNTAVSISTTLEPRNLLEQLKALEHSLGRVPSKERWGPRAIDLDILLYDGRVINEPDLAIPHPRLHERRFVLEPLAQLAPDRRHPILHKTIQQLLEELMAHK